MRSHNVLLAGLLTVVAVAGCTSGNSASTASASPPVVTTTSPDVVETTTSPSASPSASASPSPSTSPSPIRTTSGKLAVAVPNHLASPGRPDSTAEYSFVGPRPGKPTGSNCGTNVSVNKHQYNWYAYEIPLGYDEKDHRLAPRTCNDTKVVCDALRDSHANVQRALNTASEQLKYDAGSESWDGAQAIFKTATTVACPNLLQFPYQTAFDKRVAKFRTELLKYVRFTGNTKALYVTDYGVFMKHVCYATEADPSSVRDKLTGSGSLSSMYLSQIGAKNKLTLKVFVNRAVFVGCHGSFNKLDSYWTSA